MNLLLVVLWAFALPYPRFRPMASCLSTVWSCIIIVCKMLYQLKVVNPQEYSSNCSEVRALPPGQSLRGCKSRCEGHRQRPCHAEGRASGRLCQDLSTVLLLPAHLCLPSLACGLSLPRHLDPPPQGGSEATQGALAG